MAIKVLKEEFNNDDDFIRKFRRESQAAASLSHPNILNIYDVGSETSGEGKIHYIVMEYIKGKTLKEVINEKGKLSTEETVNYSIQIAEALSHAHKNHIIHRDIKPHNIMVTDDNRVKVTDFGIARAVTSSTITTTSNVLGSVHYFSPEQARGGYTDEKSDIYSLGIVIYEMLTGKVPFDGDTPIGVALKHVQEEMTPPVSVDMTIPASLNNLVMKCTRKRQSDRYQSADEVLRELRSFRAENTSIIDNTEDTTEMTRVIPIIEAPEISDESYEENRPRRASRKQDKKNRMMVIAAAVLAAFILVTSIFAGYSRLKDALGASQDTNMPNLVGSTESEAKALAEA